MRITKYRGLTTVELLALIEEKRASSPLIDELVERLEASLMLSDDQTTTAPCPICEAELTISHDADSHYLKAI